MSNPPELAPKPEVAQDGASRLAESRRKRLEDIQKREAMKDTLIEGFKAKFKSAQTGPGSARIGQEVDSFLKGSARITEANLKRLERRIEHGTREKTGDADEKMSEISEYSIAPSLMSKGSQGSKASKALDGYASSKPGKVFDWSKLDEYAAFLHEQDAHRSKQQYNVMQEKLRTDLDRQVADMRLKKQKDRESDKKYHLSQISEIEAWKESEHSKAQELRARAQQEQVERDAQLAAERSSKQAAKNKKREEEQNLVEKIAREMELEKQRLEMKKQQQKEQMQKIKEDNERENSVKEAARLEEQKGDVQAMETYNKILDDQEKLRAATIHERQEKQRIQMERMVGDLGLAMQLKADEDSRRADKQKKEADERAIEMERSKQEQLKSLRYSTQDFLFQQMDEKNKINAEALELKAQQAEILKKDAQEHKEAEQKKIQDKRARNKEHQMELTRQIAARKQNENKYAMSESEVKMNRQLLELVDHFSRNHN
eukprot:gnl/MRDRNA2_/MRDRNA2_98437_c0_seq1.p1 gnl/MRDRNA2_/MRDRNA2_98437_c0~~gnl/MRDRNA2_/MRDRNA2_98437_c0_seq1.p1  ORF type:complete len:488 (+),score=185.79 gnl/MRDRNA2_/MRDRNA2_98437_c0_seq1:83-1546(+)